MSAELENSFNSLVAIFYIHMDWDQNFMFKTQPVSFKLKQTFMTFDVTYV